MRSLARCYPPTGERARERATSEPIVGIIANPASGKDVRRLVGAASVVDNNEKVNIVRRILSGLAATGIATVHYMPEHFDIVGRALDGARGVRGVRIDMPVEGRPVDTQIATDHLVERGAGCLIVLGGDGTSRLVASRCGATPLAAVSTGTNNALPSWIDGTVAGLAAGLVATGRVDRADCAPPAKRLEVRIDGLPGQPEARVDDIALVDVALSRERFVSARAIWEPAHLAHLFLTRAEPGAIGLSAIGAHLEPIDQSEDAGLWIELGGDALTVLAPIVPGVVRSVPIASWRRIALDRPIAFQPGAGVLAVDGEKEHELATTTTFTVRVTRAGPRLVDMRRTIAIAARAGLFRADLALHRA